MPLPQLAGKDDGSINQYGFLEISREGCEHSPMEGGCSRIKANPMQSRIYNLCFNVKDDGVNGLGEIFRG
jgi:hypothetical protein